MARRPGRKRIPGVKRVSSGEINYRETRKRIEKPIGYSEVTHYVRYDENHKPVGFSLIDNSPRATLRLSPRMERAWDELVRLRDLCRRYSWDSPKPEPKTSNLLGGHAHTPELTAEIIDLGKEFHKQYRDAVDMVLKAGPQGMVKVLVDVCFENKMPDVEEWSKLKVALNLLATYWKL